MTQLTQHFRLAELDCQCGCSMPPRVLARLKRVAYALEIIRAEVGEPIKVISGYRCRARNKAVGGAAASRHIEGDAVDIQVEGRTGAELREIVEQLINAGRIPEGGLGTYADRVLTCHYDLRPMRTRWHVARPERGRR